MRRVDDVSDCTEQLGTVIVALPQNRETDRGHLKDPTTDKEGQTSVAESVSNALV